MREADRGIIGFCVCASTEPKPPLFSRLVTVELQFKLKAINLQTVRHQELPDCYDFTLTVSMRCTEFGSNLEKKNCFI